MKLKSFPADSCYTVVESPVDRLWLVASDKGLHAVYFSYQLNEKQFATLKKDPRHPVLQQAVRQLKEYFSRKRKSFDLPLVPHGTEFQCKVWRELSRIPFGKTLSYGEQAKRVGDAKAARAVGTANSRNPISIVVPCHRVIAKSGALSGFGGGVANKKYLLELEQSY